MAAQATVSQARFAAAMLLGATGCFWGGDFLFFDTLKPEYQEISQLVITIILVLGGALLMLTGCARLLARRQPTLARVVVCLAAMLALGALVIGLLAVGAVGLIFGGLTLFALILSQPGSTWPVTNWGALVAIGGAFVAGVVGWIALVRYLNYAFAWATREQ